MLMVKNLLSPRPCGQISVQSIDDFKMVAFAFLLQHLNLRKIIFALGLGPDLQNIVFNHMNRGIDRSHDQFRCHPQMGKQGLRYDQLKLSDPFEG